MARRLHVVPDALPLALIRGEGTHARVVATDLLLPTGGPIIGWNPNRARALVHGLRLISWDPALEDRLHQETQGILQLLETLSPRCTPVGPGVFWTEPFTPRGQREGERHFAETVLHEITNLGFVRVRVGIADGPIAAAAATRRSDGAWHRVKPGHDAEFLGDLPLDVLPLSPRALELFRELGVGRVLELQAMSPESLSARFGVEGVRARRYAYGQDPRRPRSHRRPTVTYQEVLLETPCDHLDPLLYVLRSSLDELVCGLARRGRRITNLSLTLLTSDGGEHSIQVSPCGTTSGSELLFRLIHRNLLEAPPLSEGASVEGMRLDASGTSACLAKQGDLFRGRLEERGDLEVVVSRLVQRLGRAALQMPARRDDHHPDREGFWVTLDPSVEGDHPGMSTPSPLSACARRLEVPVPIRRTGPRRWESGAGSDRMVITAWHGPEVLSGRWWQGPFDRGTYWCLTEDQRVLWIYEDRLTGRWYLQGWLD